MAVVRVPGSSANLGPGFDGVGMAVSLYVEAGVVGVDPMPDRARQVDQHHPALVANREAGGSENLWLHGDIPMGRGLGFSGAARVAGALLAVNGGASCEPRASETKQHVIDVTSRLEGHADNVAASLLGGIVGTNGREASSFLPGCPLEVVVWIPDFTTSTSESRAKLPASVSFGDAVFNVTQTALLMAALAAGDLSALSEATADRLHQEARFVKAESSRVAFAAMLSAGAVCAWLSGSGPTVACFAPAGAGAEIVPRLPDNGRAKVLAIDAVGAVFV